MTPLLSSILHSSAFKGALAGWLSAAGVDFQAFRSWKSFHDAAVYQWGTALWRWLQGAVLGAVAGGGYGAMVS